MKKISQVLLVMILLTACSAPDKEEKLEQLKNQRAEIEKEIALLEKETGKSDSAAVDNGLQVGTETVKAQSFRTYIEIQGRVEAKENVNLSTGIPGTITRIHVQAGDKVKQGQLLAETDARAIQQMLSEVQTNLDLARQTHEKYKRLWDQKIGTEMQYLQTKTQMESMETRLAGVQEQLRMSRIISPIDGTVDNVNIKLGQAVAPGLPAIRVINFSDLRVEADVAESYTGRVKTGNEVEVLFPDLNDSITSKISYASRAIDPLSRTFRVEVKLDGKKEFHPNMVARLRINDYVSKDSAIVLPVKYIQRGASESFVFVAEKGLVVKRPVTISREYSGQAEISSGLKPGDELITQGYDLVNEGDRINISRSEK